MRLASGTPSRIPPVRRRLLVALASAFVALAPAGAQNGPEKWVAGPYAFSDELGGFTITEVSGRGTRTDPFIVRQELDSASPVTLTIRAVKPIRPFDSSGEYATGFLHLRVEIVNNSQLPWVEFEFELQERLGEASVFGDGLSFDQRRTDGGNISSTAFASYNRNFEPYDRLRFAEGTIDHGRTGTFGFLITDFTPRRQFYLVEDPRIPSS